MRQTLHQSSTTSIPWPRQVQGREVLSPPQLLTTHQGSSPGNLGAQHPQHPNPTAPRVPRAPTWLCSAPPGQDGLPRPGGSCRCHAELQSLPGGHGQLPKRGGTGGGRVLSPWAGLGCPAQLGTLALSSSRCSTGGAGRENSGHRGHLNLVFCWDDRHLKLGAIA